MSVLRSILALAIILPSLAAASAAVTSLALAHSADAHTAGSTETIRPLLHASANVHPHQAAKRL